MLDCIPYYSIKKSSKPWGIRSLREMHKLEEEGVMLRGCRGGGVGGGGAIVARPPQSRVISHQQRVTFISPCWFKHPNLAVYWKLISLGTKCLPTLFNLERRIQFSLLFCLLILDVSSALSKATCLPVIMFPQKLIFTRCRNLA